MLSSQLQNKPKHHPGPCPCTTHSKGRLGRPKSLLKQILLCRVSPSLHNSNRSPEPHYQGRKQCLSPWRMGSQVQRDTWPPRAGVAGQEPILHGRKRRCDNEAAPSLTAPASGKALRWEARLCKLDRFLPNTKRQGESRGVQLPFRWLSGH